MDAPANNPNTFPVNSNGMASAAGDNLDKIEEPLVPVEDNKEREFKQEGYRLVIGNNRNNQGNVPKENSLVKLLHQRNNLIMNSGAFPIGVPTGIFTSSNFSGGGDLDIGQTSSETPSVMKFLETNPDEVHKMLQINKQLKLLLKNFFLPMILLQI
jgi:hypothetical protein